MEQDAPSTYYSHTHSGSPSLSLQAPGKPIAWAPMPGGLCASCFTRSVPMSFLPQMYEHVQ